MNISVSSSFIDTDAEELVRAILDLGVNVAAVISTREPGDNRVTDAIVTRIKKDHADVPFIEYSAKKRGRLGNPDEKEQYDGAILGQLHPLPDINVMVGDMIVKGETWCKELPSLNLHPDLPGGFRGMYWEVVGKWVQGNRREIGGMMHLTIPALDAGTPVTFFRLPARGRIRGVDLGPLWDMLPREPDVLEELIQSQVGLKGEPTHPLFQELRRSEAGFESDLVLRTISAFAVGDLRIVDGGVFGSDGAELTGGYDLTKLVVGDQAIWPGGEGTTSGLEAVSRSRHEMDV